ncbi:MAG TPA: hypothetical protein VN461_00530 [Vicinamibacteria bacterium]|jgi:hypothetical protein|nr:hypothetical protein [Vicinamibacteria bacterium]
MPSRLVATSVGLLLFTLAAWTAGGAKTPIVRLETGRPGLGMMDETFMVALPIDNAGAQRVDDLQVTGVSLGSAPLLSPTSFPVILGPIPPGGHVIFQADFEAGNLEADFSYTLTVTGTYTHGPNGRPIPFTLTREVSTLPASPGSATAKSGSARPESPSGPPFPPFPHGFSPEVNTVRLPTPVGPFVPGNLTQPSTSVEAPPNGHTASALLTKPLTDPPVAITTNRGVGVPQSDIWPITEPSGASGGGVVFVTFNPYYTTGAAYSLDGGSTYRTIDLQKAFPHDGIGICCDQVVQYVPKIDRFIWIMQGPTHSQSGQGDYRLAAASPAEIKKHHGLVWTTWKLDAHSIGQPDPTDFDYPSMSVGNNSLYVSWDVGWQACGTKKHPCTWGREVLRIPLSDIQAGGAIHFRYTHPSNSYVAWASAVTQDTKDEVFWAGHNGTSQLRVFSWAEGSNIYHWEDVKIATYVRNPPGTTNNAGKIIKVAGHEPSYAPYPLAKLLVPHTRDWLWRFSDDIIMGATRSGKQVWFAWDAAPKDDIPQPYIEMVTLDRSADFTVVQQEQIWNSAFAFGFPSLATNACTGEIGLSLARGGGNTDYENHAVGFWGDFKVYDTTDANATTGLFGDYLTIRQNPTADLHGAFFDAFGFALNKASTAGPGHVLPESEINVDIRYAVFGRSGACPRP